MKRDLQIQFPINPQDIIYNMLLNGPESLYKGHFRVFRKKFEGRGYLRGLD